MAVTDINAQALPVTGHNLTDSGAFTTLGLGAGNGVRVAFPSRGILILKNSTGVAATFTLKLKTIDELDTYSLTPTDPTIAVADGKIYLVKFDEDALKDSDGNVTIECDVAGEVLVVTN